MKISETIAKITNNFTTGFSRSTLMGWVPNYDHLGRPLNYDPNYQSGSVTIEGKEYYFVRKEWIVRIWDEPVSYMAFLNNRPDFIEEVDLTPDYLKND